MEENKNLSTILLDALRARNLTIEKLAQMTGISERILENLLEEKFDRLPASPYVHGYLIKIASALNLEGEKLWHEYLKRNNAVKSSGAKDRLPVNRFASSSFNKKMGGIALAILLFGFVGFKLYRFFGPPELVLFNLTDGSVVQESALTLTGTLNPNDKLTLNNEEVYADNNGMFETTVTLSPGLNVLDFKIKKFLGKEYTITKQIFYKTATSTEVMSNIINE